ncbi:MAG: HD domain-containing protein, partial [Candidatus Accumulibacter sp.]|nr:HD domain-containing protein [Accumulibacter sp.]
LGFELLDGSESAVLQAAATIARSHHEKFDGSGYPAGLSGTAIPLFGRIVAVADVFDALVSDRPYKRQWPPERALDFLQQGANTHFDPRCVAAFLARQDEALEIRARYQDEQFTDEL